MASMTEADIDHVISFVMANYGIDLSKKRTFVEVRTQKYMNRYGHANYSLCFASLCADVSGQAMAEFIGSLLVNFTSFYREPMHFDFLLTTVLPQLNRQLGDNKTIYSWSAGCSTGEEPYTIAMVIQDYFNINKEHWDTKILATDVSTFTLDKAKEAVYPYESIAELPLSWINTYFTKDRENKAQVSVAPMIRREVEFRKHNLVANDFTFKHKFHFIFCRNVMIYFNESTKKRLLDTFYDLLEDGGYLFIGTSERINAPSPYTYIKPSIYRKVVT